MEQIPNRRRVVFSDYFSPLGQMAISGRVFIPECRGVTEVPKDEKYILVTKDASPTNLIYLGNAMAVVSEVGGILIHLAIACRELDIPFIRIDEATKALKDGEFVELVMKPKIKEKEPPEEWIKVYQILGDFVLTLQKDELEKRSNMVSTLPSLINKEYKLVVRFERSEDRISFYVSNESLAGFMVDLRQNIDVLYSKLLDYESMNNESKFSVSILGMLAIERCLFPWLVELAGDRKKALSLIRSGWAHYLELNGTGSMSLMRFGIPEGRMETPQVLKDRFAGSKSVRRHEIKSAVMGINDPEKVEQVANSICFLIRAYEDKDRPSRPG